MDINNFGPFQAGVWGNLSDWVMIVVTTITGIYLILTFRSQQLLKKVELLKYVDSIKPDFNLEVTSRNYDNSGPKINVEVSLLVTNLKALAIDVTLYIKDTDALWKFYGPADVEIQFPLKKARMPQFMLTAEFNGDPTDTTTFGLIISYKDKLGNFYYKTHICSFDNGIEEIKASIPINKGEPILKI